MINKILSFFLIIGLFACETVKREKPKPEELKYTHHSDWSKSAVIYELNIRQFSDKGDFNSIIPQLDRLKEMGVDIIWLMPVHPIGEKNRKGGLGSYYAVKDYTDVNPNYGSMDDFKNLVDEIHKRDMHVLIDWVANHSAWDNPWVSEHPDWYTKDSLGNMIPPIGTNWSDVVDFNYENPGLRRGMIDAMKFWITDCKIDGFRCDVADWVPVDFWEQARQSLDSSKADLFMLAEAENPKHYPSFDMSYGWEMHHISNEIAKGKMNFNNIKEYMVKEDTNFNENVYRMQFTTNHDENSWNGTALKRYGDNFKNWAVVMATIDGMPLLYSGQDSKLNKALRFFEKDTIDWDDYALENFYTGLFSLKDSNEALWNGKFGGAFKMIENSQPNNILTYSRVNGNNVVLVAVNFDSVESTFSIMNTELGEFDSYNSDEKLKVDEEGAELILNGNDYKIFIKK